MKKIFYCIVCLSLLFAQNCFAVDEWDKSEPSSDESPSDISTLITTNNEALDRFMSYGRFGCKLSYSTVAQFTVGAGSVVCSNSSGTIRKTRSNSSDTTVTWSNLDTGTESNSTTYHVYAVGDADTATFTVTISTDSSSPTGITYYKHLGSIYNDSDGNITVDINDDSKLDIIPVHNVIIKGWASVTYSGGIPTLNDSYNVSGITDTATGKLTITWDTDFSSTNYALNVSLISGGNNIWPMIESKATGSCVVSSISADGNYTDPAGFDVIAIGEQ